MITHQYYFFNNQALVRSARWRASTRRARRSATRRRARRSGARRCARRCARSWQTTNNKTSYVGKVPYYRTAAQGARVAIGKGFLNVRRRSASTSTPPPQAPQLTATQNPAPLHSTPLGACSLTGAPCRAAGGVCMTSEGWRLPPCCRSDRLPHLPKPFPKRLSHQSRT